MKTVMQTPPKYLCAINPSHDNHTGHWRAFTPGRELKLSPCRLSCPCGTPVPAWLAAVGRGQWAQAWQIMQQTNPFPAITGQVCYRYCQEQCYRGAVDEAINIARIEREIGNWRHKHVLPPPGPNSSRKVAIVGSGPAGLSCAYYLRRRGLQVTVYERAPVAGGLLALAIPSYRLSRRLLEREIEALARDGVRFKLNRPLSRQEIAGRLAGEYQAVFLAAGAPAARLPALPGLELAGVWTALDFLEKINLGEKFNPGEKIKVAGPVIVIGGGNTALDAARVALRGAGSGAVTVLYRRRREAMKAHPAEIEAAEQEGVEFIYNAHLQAICGDEQVERVVYSPVEGGTGASIDPVGRDCRTLIMALGQEPDQDMAGLEGPGLPVFSGGDQVTGPSNVPAAIAGGRRGAEAIISYLFAEKAAPAPPPRREMLFSGLHLDGWPGAYPRLELADPVQEAGRCLGCGNCNYCGRCALFCPEAAVAWEEGEYRVNLDYCKGCGICARECPAGVLVMEGEENVC